MTMDLETIKSALAKATPGPWCEPHWDYKADQQEIWGGPLVRIALIPTGEDDDSTTAAQADAHLIANAPTWLADLVAEVERLRGVVSRVVNEIECNDYDGGISDATMAEAVAVIPSA